ncbi:hypothetical protein IQ260_24345 [Leptolyngbya cf. ectocarpi LEGE 11479]|uniref:Uncharacterized protein n=1 Tax=Leptolyngbya cf. ectocarpi LEGE 11479 TaxID=1828722 RepID=A0A928ZYH3_LEPEC|nr:hypothetical protein [Leptolyngbya ectocarpi]MBE9069777.1 hypothetical protein [Leptolyngbya cf. ectocarpi LEGE 11479]
MPPSSRPYQSKLLRFALQQWQQGLERQNQAWRQLQSTAAWGAQVAVFPIYAIMRAVKRASFVLSGHSDHSSEQSEQPSGSIPQENVTDSDHTLTAILTHTQQLLASEKISQLAVTPKGELVKTAQSFLSRTSGALTARTAGIRRKMAAELLQNGTTLASSIKTRNLVLVNPNNEVFDIFTPEHQANLKHYIDRVMYAYQQSRTIIPRSTRRLSVQTAIKISAGSDSSLTAVLTHTQQLLSSDQKAQLNIAPTGSLARKVKSLLANTIQRIRQQLPGSLQSARRNSIIQAQRQSGDLVSSSTRKQSGGLKAPAGRRAASDLLPHGTTLASSIATRQLVLVNEHNKVFDIFTPEQQAELKHYITAVMLAYQQSRSIVPRQTKRLSIKTVLAIGAVFIAALPMEFKKAWAQITPGPTLGSQAPSLPHITNNKIAAQPSSRIFHPTSSAPGTVRTRAQRLSSHGNNHARRRLTSKSPNAFEANVNDVSYLEHPLERVLRWIDRILTWCENRWQQWLEHRTNAG